MRQDIKLRFVFWSVQVKPRPLLAIHRKTAFLSQYKMVKILILGLIDTPIQSLVIKRWDTNGAACLGNAKLSAVV